jgi:hypothetical protein
MLLKGVGIRHDFESVADLLQFYDKDLAFSNGLLQRWLYFGLLWEIFYKRLDTQDLVVFKDSKDVLSSALLPQYSQEWLQRSSSLSHQRLEQAMEQR